MHAQEGLLGAWRDVGGRSTAGAAAEVTHGAHRCRLAEGRRASPASHLNTPGETCFVVGGMVV